jgi:hypothetical protein
MAFDPKIRVESNLFKYSKMFGGKEYILSPMNPYYVKNCTQQKALENAAQARKEGWAARVVKVGTLYVVYERRTGREMRPKKGHKRLY